jgi:hypothetical protein
MTNPTIEPLYYEKKARHIRAQVFVILRKWGLLPRFKRWRLAQDPDSGMVVLFGILNNRFIAMHTSTPFSDYFDPRLLRDLTDALHTRVVACNGDGLRYAFVLERGQIDVLPTHIDYPFVRDERLFVRVAYEKSPVIAVMEPPIVAVSPEVAAAVDDQMRVQRGVGAFLKVFDDIKTRDNAAARLYAQSIPDIVVIDRDEFNKRVVEQENAKKRQNPGSPSPS